MNKKEKEELREIACALMESQIIASQIKNSASNLNIFIISDWVDKWDAHYFRIQRRLRALYEGASPDMTRPEILQPLKLKTRQRCA